MPLLVMVWNSGSVGVDMVSWVVLQGNGRPIMVNAGGSLAGSLAGLRMTRQNKKAANQGTLLFCVDMRCSSPGFQAWKIVHDICV